jgi:hypothetical protein
MDKMKCKEDINDLKGMHKGWKYDTKEWKGTEKDTKICKQDVG